jgi:hypothetical protein
MFNSSSSSTRHEAKRQRLLSEEVVVEAEEAEEEDIDRSTQSQSQSQSQSKPFNSQDTAFTVVPSSSSAVMYDHLPDTEATLPLAMPMSTTSTTTTTIMMSPRQQQQHQPQPQQLPAAVVNNPIPANTNHHDPRVIIESTLFRLELDLTPSRNDSIGMHTLDIVQALKVLRKWADDDTKDHHRLFLKIFWELDGITKITKLLKQLLVVKQQQEQKYMEQKLRLRRQGLQLRDYNFLLHPFSSSYNTSENNIWENLKHIARIISHCTHSGMDGKKKQNQDIASKIAKKFVANDGLKTLLQIAFLNDDNDDDDDTGNETTPNENATATATYTPSNNSVSKNTTDKFRAICYIWGGLMNVASHKIAIQNSTLNQEQTQLVFDCGIRTIQLLKKQQQKNKNNENTVAAAIAAATATATKNDNKTNNCDDIPYYKILKNVFGTLANVLNFHNRDNVQPPTLRMNDIFHITINDVLKKEKENHNTKEEVNNDNDDDNDDKSEWDYNVEVWKKVSFFFLLCQQRCILRVADTAAAAVTPPVNGIDKVGDTNNDGRNNDGDATAKVISNDFEIVISFCIEYIEHDPNEAHQAGIFSILQQYCLGPDNFDDDDDDDEAVVAYDEMYCASQYIRNIPGFIIILGTILDAKKYNSYGDDDNYTIEQRTKVATKKLLSSILRVE